MIKVLLHRPPPSAATHGAQAMEEIMAMVEGIAKAAQSGTNDSPPMGHGPQGAHEACANMAEEGLAQQFAAPKFTKEATDLRNMLQALEEMDVDTDEECEAPSERDEETEAAKKANKARARAARKEQVKNCKAKVLAKICEY